MIDLSSEISLQTTRSGGKGGQNVNKVETAVIASINIPASVLLNEEKQQVILQKLANRINKEGCLVIKAQTFRTQLENKEDAIRKIHEAVSGALKKKKPRIATKPSRGAKEQRLESKKRSGERKAARRRIVP